MLTTMVSVAARITALELAVIAVANQELGDSPGHPFRGNQYQAAAEQAQGHEHAYREMARGADADQIIRESRIASDRATRVADRAYHEGRIAAAQEAKRGQPNPGQPSVIGTPVRSGSDRITSPDVPEQRHGLAQDRHSYDVEDDDVESFSIDDDGTVTFGDSPGHPFRGNQYAGGMSHEEAHTRAENHGANFQREHPDVAKQVGREATRYLDRYMNDSPNTEASSTRDQMLNRYRATDNGTKIGPASTPSGYLPHNPVQTYASPLASGAARMQQGTASDSEVRAVGNFMRRTEETQ